MNRSNGWSDAPEYRHEDWPERPSKRPVISSLPYARRIEFWPIAYRFRQSHPMRIIVASGAHPRYARKLGSGEPLADAVTFAIAQQEIFHDPDHPSRILLPIRIGKDSPPRPTLVMGLRVLAQDIGPKRFTTANKGMDG